MDLIRRLVMTKIKTEMMTEGRIITGKEDGRARVLPAPHGNAVGKEMIGAARAHRPGLHHDRGREERSETAELFILELKDY